MKHQNIPTQTRFAVVGLLAALTLSLTAQADDKIDVSKLPPAATKTGVTFATDIKPLFDTACVKCHGEERPKAKLQLNTLEGVLKGSKEGKVVEPGKIEKSPLLVSIAHLPGDEDNWMPPKNNKAKIAPLTKEQVGLVRAWIEQGAK